MATENMTKESFMNLASSRKILLIQGRNFGDSVIVTGLIEALGRSVNGVEISVLTRPSFKEIYEYNPFVSQVYYENFPMGTNKQFGSRAALNLILKLAALRRQRFTDALHATGDFREIFMGWLVAPSGNFGLVWEPGNPLGHLNRSGLKRLLSHPTRVAAELESYYAVIQHFATSLGATALARPRLYRHDGSMLTHRPIANTIGFHMSASQNSKLWPIECWKNLLNLLKNQGFAVTIFGAPSEREKILNDLGTDFDSAVNIITGPLDQFFEGLSRMSAVVCLDSFSLHAAYAIGVPGLLINGANRASMWLPPGFELVDGGQGLPCAPCFNVPTCKRTDHPYRCVRDISVAAVVAALERLGIFKMASSMTDVSAT